MAPMPRLASRVPRTSVPRRRLVSRVSGTKRSAIATAARLKGMLIQNAHRQLKSVASQPPSRGPTAAIPPIIEPYTANAMPRSRPWNMALIVESVEGITRAAPMPWTSRAPINQVGFCAVPTPRLATMKMVSPTTNSRRRPYRSLRRPASRMSEANTRE